MANHPGPGVGLRKEGLWGPSGIAGPPLAFGPRPRALWTTAGRYGMTE
jgi:hypothetical protein